MKNFYQVALLCLWLSEDWGRFTCAQPGLPILLGQKCHKFAKSGVIFSAAQKFGSWKILYFLQVCVRNTGNNTTILCATSGTARLYGKRSSYYWRLSSGELMMAMTVVCQTVVCQVGRDIPLDGGWIKIHCGGSCPIVFNKVCIKYRWGLNMTRNRCMQYRWGLNMSRYWFSLSSSPKIFQQS